MAAPNIDVSKAKVPAADGEINEYVSEEARASRYFNAGRKVIFVNGMLNSGADHVESALALSLVQMSAVIGVYNKSVSGWADFTQCIGDKNQFDGPISLSAHNQVTVGRLFSSRTSVQVARAALSRNPAAVALFDLLRRPENRNREIFAHSQGNLILSNALQAIGAVEGAAGLAGRTIHTFGSPAVNWPAEITKYEHAFTWDPVTFLAGFDSTWTIYKVGMPSGSGVRNPITHAFLEYLKLDPAFLVNRYRVGSFGMTFNMDEAGLANALVAMGGNMRRVRSIFEHLEANHGSDVDDIAVLYVAEVAKSPALKTALRAERPLVQLLTRVMSGGWTGADEKKAVAFLQTL
jgi:hypothetical protein